MASSVTRFFRTSRRRGLRPALILLVCLVSPSAGAQDTIELETTTIKGNKELPKILYIVPWKEVEQSRQAQQQLVLHSLSDGLFDPVLPLKY